MMPTPGSSSILPDVSDASVPQEPDEGQTPSDAGQNQEGDERRGEGHEEEEDEQEKNREKQEEIQGKEKSEEQDDLASQASRASHDPLEMVTRHGGDPRWQRYGTLMKELEAEKKRYPGARTWTKDEAKFFEILYLRQELPMLPKHWEVDFRGVPMVASLFQTSRVFPPIIYAHSKKEFQATTALLRLIDLTANIRTTCQSGLSQKATVLLKKGLQKYVDWAAEDGGYKELKYVQNISVEIISLDSDQEGIANMLQHRMRALARLQREFFRTDRDEGFWNVDEKRKKKLRLSDAEMLLEKYASSSDEGMSEAPSPAGDSDTDSDAGTSKDDEAPTMGGAAPHSQDEMETGQDEPRINEQWPTHESVEGGAPASACRGMRGFRRRPPVVYGLFVMGTSVLIVTVDAAKGDGAYVSFHVDLDFMDNYQSVWNALTVAIAVCLARDELMARTGDFEPADVVEESDPDL